MGPQKTKYTLHDAFVNQKSAYFRAQGRKGQREIVLEEVEADVFDAYVHWVFLSEVECDNMLDQVAHEENQTVPPWTKNLPRWLCVVKLLILADYLQDDKLCNDLISGIVAFVDSKLNGLENHQCEFDDFISAIEYAFRHLAAPSLLRNLLADIFHLELRETLPLGRQMFETACKRLSKEVLFQLAKHSALSEDRPALGIWGAFDGLKRENYYKQIDETQDVA